MRPNKMNNEIFFDGKQYISAHDASELSGLTRDYVARLCRSGKLQGKQIGKNWYIENAGLRAFLVGQEYSKSLRREALARERVKEYRSLDAASVGEAGRSAVVTKHAPASQARFVSESSTASGVVSAPVNRAIRVGNAGTFAASPVYEKLSAAVARKGSAVFGGVANLTASPLGVADAAARLAAKSVAHVPAYAITPVAEFFHKLTALTLAFMLTFGTYALVDPRSAHFAGESAKDAARSLRATYDSVTGGGMQHLAENVQSQVALAAENPSATFASASAAIGNFVPQAAASLARAVHTRVNALVYAIAFPQSLINFGGGSSGGSVAVNIAPYAAPRSGPPGEHSAKQNVVAVSPSTIIQNPIRERTVEVQRIVAESGGITEEELNERLNQLNNKLVSQIYSITAVGGSTPVASGGITNMIAATNRIDQLSGAAITGGTITGTTISGGSISGTSVSATTLSSSGDTSLASTTVNGDLTVTGAVNFTGTPLTAVNAAFVSATSTNLFATSSVFVSATTTNFFATNANFTNSTSTNSYSSSLVAGNATSTNQFTTNLVATSATTTNFFSTLGRFTTGIVDTLTSTLATITGLNVTNSTTTNATSTNAFNTNLVATSATSTNSYVTNSNAVNSTSTNLNATAAVFTNATSTNLFSTLAHFTTGIIDTFTSTLATITGLNVTNSTTTNATSTNAFSTNLVATNATSTTLFSVLSNFTTSIISTLTAVAATITDLVATNLTATNATTTNATSTNAYASNLNAVTASTTNLTASGAVVINSTTTNATSTNLYASKAAFDAATTTNLFSTTASSTNLFSTNGNIGVLSAGSLTLSSALSVSSGGTGASSLGASQLVYGNGTGAVATVATSTLSTGTGLVVSSGSLGYQVGGSAATIGFAAIAANSLWANMTGAAAVPTVVSTSSLFTWTGTGDVVRGTSPTLVTPTISGGTFTGTQSLAAASTSLLSVFQNAYFGATATTTIDSTGAITVTSTSKNTFPYASSTALSVSGTGYFGTASTTNLTVSSLTANRIPYVAAAGAFTDSANLTFDGSALALTGSATISSTLGVTGLASFTQASTTRLSVTDRAYFGGTATSTFDSTGALTLVNALTYGGVTLSNAVTGTGNMVLSASPTFTGTIAAAALNTSGVITSTATGANTFPYASSTALTVSGHCVTADTRLRRRRRRSDGSYEYDEPEITDLDEGDEIQSLDEKTGEMVWSRVNKVMFMGVKKTYRIVTEDGRTIRTTAEHPYLVDRPKKRTIKHASPIKDAAWVKASDIRVGQHIAVPKPRLGIFVDDGNMFYAQRKAGIHIDYAHIKEQLEPYFDVQFVNYHMVMPSNKDTSYTRSVAYKRSLPPFITVYEKALKYIKVTNPDGTQGIQKKGDVDMELAIDVLRNLEKLDAVLVLAGDSDYVALRSEVLRKGKKIAFASFDETVSWEIKTGKYISLARFAAEAATDNHTAHVKGVKRQTPDLSAGRLLRGLLYSGGSVMSRGYREGVDNGTMWARVLSIEPVAEEDVYDMEIEGTHNFVANGIIAHNTYLGTVSASGLSTLGQASTTLFSSYGPAYFGATATSSFSSAGVLTLATDLAVSEGGT
ncbi:MAG: NYN domain-containing protein, partial [Patescibacteria group bacterium]